MPMPKKLMPFGKFKGEPIEDLPSEYLTWCLENFEGKEELCAEMQAQLDMRAGKGVERKGSRFGR